MEEKKKMSEFKKEFLNDLRQYNPTAVIVSPYNRYLDDIIEASVEAGVLIYFSIVKNDGFTFAFKTLDGARGFKSEISAFRSEII